MKKVETVINKEIWEKVKKGITIVNEEQMLRLSPEEALHLMSEYETGRNTFNKITCLLSGALLSKLPSSAKEITIQLIAK